MAGAQASYLSTLAADTDRDVPEHPSKAEASKLSDTLRGRSQRTDATRRR